MFIRKSRYNELIETCNKLLQENKTYQEEIEHLRSENSRLRLFLHEDSAQYCATLKIEKHKGLHTLPEFEITVVYYDEDYNTVEVCLGLHNNNLARILRETDNYIHIRIGTRVYKHMKYTDTVMEVTELYGRQ